MSCRERHRFSGSWGYRIDYDKEIANDEREIAQLVDPRLVGLIATLSEEELGWLDRYGVTAYTLLLAPSRRDERLAILGITPADLGAMVAVAGAADKHDAELEELVDEFCTRREMHPLQPVEQRRAEWARVQELLGQLDGMQLIAEARRVELVRKLRARRARHLLKRGRHG